MSEHSTGAGPRDSAPDPWSPAPYGSGQADLRSYRPQQPYQAAYQPSVPTSPVPTSPVPTWYADAAAGPQGTRSP